VLGTATKLGVEFSVTARQDKKIRAAIEAIAEDAWTPIPYWLSSPEVSGADVAETTYTAFSGKDAIDVRLVVRRVRPTPGSQLALFTTWDCLVPGLVESIKPGRTTANGCTTEVSAGVARACDPVGVGRAEGSGESFGCV